METPLSKKLQHFIPFDEWSEDIIEELTPHFREHTLSARKILFKRGQSDDECHFLLSGGIDLADDDFNINGIDADSDENFMALDNTHVVHRYTGITRTPCQLVSVKRAYLELISTWSEFRQSESRSQHDEESDWLERLITSDRSNWNPSQARTQSPASSSSSNSSKSRLSFRAQELVNLRRLT